VPHGLDLDMLLLLGFLLEKLAWVCALRTLRSVSALSWDARQAEHLSQAPETDGSSQ